MKIKTYLCTLVDKYERFNNLYINVLAKNGTDAVNFLLLNYSEWDLKDMAQCAAEIVEYVDGTFDTYPTKEEVDEIREEHNKQMESSDDE